jgi:tetratricopeptide (TPR) repeat protein
VNTRTCTIAAVLCWLLSNGTGRAAEASSTDPQLKQALAAYKEGQMPKAAQLLLAYTDAQPVDPEGWYWLGKCNLQMGRLPDAVDALTRAVLIRPDYVEAYRPLGLAEFQAGDSIAAAHTWQIAVSLNNKDQQSKSYLGILFFQAGAIAQAQNWLEKALADKPSDPQTLLYLGLCEEHLKHPERAEELMQKAVAEGIEQHAPLPAAFFELAEFERRKGREDLALNLLEQASALCPEAHTLTALSDVYKGQRRLPDAERVLRQAVALNPNLAEAHYKLALLLKANQKPDEAHAELAAFERTKKQTVFPDLEK